MRTVAIIVVLLLASVASVFASSGSSLSDTYIIPAAAHAEGAQGTYWRTDVAIVNPYDWRSITVEIKYLVSGEDNTNASEHSFTIGANELLLLEDVVFATFGESGTGALYLESTDGAYFTASARTYTGDTATFGQTENGQKSRCHDDDTALVTGIRETSRYRTNIGVVNVARWPADIRARVYDSDGDLVGTKTFELDAWSQQQVSLASFGAAAASGYVLWDCLTTSSSSWVAYASVVDNNSGDAVFLEERENAEYTQYRPTYDLEGWWYGSFSGPAGSGNMYVDIGQDGAELWAYTFTLDGNVELYLYGYADSTHLTIESGFGFTIPCWDDWVTDGEATASSSSINGSYSAVGDCYEGTTTFYLEPTSPPKFSARAEALISAHRTGLAAVRREDAGGR